MPPESPDNFLDELARCGLLTSAQTEEFTLWAKSTNADVQAIARELNRRGWLTPFQIKEVYKGRWAGLTIGPFLLLELIGEGGMGRVYKALHTRLGRDVALKVIRKEKLSNPQTIRRFHQEIQAVAHLSHPNVVLAFDADQVNETNYLAMEYVEGIDLTKLVKARGPLPIPEACEYIRQGAIGLQHAFERGLVHRDVKPSNFIVAKSGQVKVLDLGLAMLKEMPGGEEASRVTQEGFVLGTPDFLAPEQAKNPLAVDTRADVYALGATLFYLLTGKVPYDGASPTEKMIRHVSDPPPQLRVHRPEAPQQLDAIIQWMMAKRPEDRPQTPIQAAIALQPFCPPSTGSFPVNAVKPSHPDIALQPAPPEVPRSSQSFKLPGTGTPVRVRERGRTGVSRFTTAMVTIVALVTLGVLGFILYRIAVPPVVPPEPGYTNEVKMQFVLIPAGSFTIGSPDTEVGRSTDESPAHEVTLTNPIYFATTEVMNGPYATLMGTSPSITSSKARWGGEMPVESVTWEEAQEFCKRLNDRDRTKRSGWEYRLPTEAEWEYACRATTTTPFAFGEKLLPNKSAIFTPATEDPLSEEEIPRPLGLPNRVGQTVANKFGLYDMHGNVWEWCQDYYVRGYPAGAQTNPAGPSIGDLRAIRGGSFSDPGSKCRSASRRGLPADTRDIHVGFRIVLAPLP